MVVAVVLLRWYSFFALMIADSVKHLVHTSVSAWLLWRGLDGYGGQRLTSTILRTLLAAAGMGVLAALVMIGLEAVVPFGGIPARLIVVGVAGAVGVASFSRFASWLGLEEWRWMRRLVEQRLGR